MGVIMIKSHTPMTIKARMNKNIEKALEVMELALSDVSLSSDKRYKIASDYISVYLRMDNEKRKEEDHRESMRGKKLNNIKSEFQISEIEEGFDTNQDTTSNPSFSTKVVV
jgi:hypothetical protein